MAQPSRRRKRGAAWLLAFLLLAASASWALAHTLTRPARPSAGADRPEGYQEVVDELRAWDLEAAERLLTSLRQKAPGLPEWDGLEGALAYLRGEFPRSIERLDAGLRKRPGDSEWLELRLHVRQSQAAVEGFSVHRTPHFEIWYDPKAESILLAYLEEALETAHKVLGDELGEKPRGPVRFEVFSDPDRFNKASTLSRRDIEDKGAVGISKFNKLMILSPGALLRGYRWLDTAAHEYVHYLIVRRTRNRAPIWLHEGIAKYLEKRWRGQELPHLHPGEEALLARARERNTFIAFQRMEPSLIYLDTPEEVQLAYAEAASAAEFIHRRAGRTGLARLLLAIGEAKEPARSQKLAGKESSPAPPSEEEPKPPSVQRSSLVELESTGPEQSAEPGLRQLFGVDLAGFEKLWVEDLKRRPLRPHPGAQVQRHRLKPTGPMDESAADLAALKSAVARRRMRLGDRLSVGERMQAALIEYTRALRDEPHSQALLNRVAQVEIQLGHADRALRHLGKALEVDPDYATTHVHRAMALEMSGNLPAARGAWEEVIQINPFVPLAHERLAALYEQAGEEEKAKREREVVRALRGR